MKIQSFLTFPVVAFSALLGFSATTSAQILLSADNFAVLGGTGSVTNAGTTAITGNVGSSTSVTGFPPGTITVNGSPATPITGGPTVQAQLDLIKAENGLSGMASTANESGTDLGGLTLLPGVYTFDTAAALDGTLTLNANNQSNAVWVFQINTALTTGISSAVILENALNGGSGDGIYWDAKTAITIGTNSSTLGNYLAGTSITLNGNDSGIGGRYLAQAGVTITTASSLNSTGDAGHDGYDAGLMYNGTGQVVPSVAVPEPAAFLWLAPLAAMGLALCRPRSVRNKIVAQ